ncbi:MAG: tetratricopeptide repeat protein [Pseudomonadota bacterium]
MLLMSVNLKRHLTAIAAAVLLGGPVTGGFARAEPAPPEMLDRLAEASEVDAPNIARELEQIWSRSGSAAMDLLLKRGRDALEAEDFPLAIEHLTALTDHAPDFAEGYSARAEAFFRADLYGPALADLERALALNPHNFNAIFGLGVMFQEFGNYRRAARLYRRVLAIYPHHKEAATALSYLKREGIGREL